MGANWVKVDRLQLSEHAHTLATTAADVTAASIANNAHATYANARIQSTQAILLAAAALMYLTVGANFPAAVLYCKRIGVICSRAIN